KIGQEHKFFDAHEKTLQSKIVKYYKALDVLTVLSEDDRVKYKETITMPDTNVVVQYNGTSPVEFSPGDEVKVSSVAQHKIVFLGRLDRLKGIEFLIEAFARITDDFPDWSVDIFGSG